MVHFRKRRRKSAYVKKFLNKLKNASSFRSLSILKNPHFKLLIDSTYFSEEEDLNSENSKLNGFQKYFMSFKKIYVNWISKCKKNSFWKNMRSIVKGNKFVIHPYENFKVLWDIIHFILIIFWFFYTPIFIAFAETHDMESFISLLSMIFLCFDIFLNFNTAYFKNGVVEKRRRKIFSNYCGKKLYYDIFTLIPIILDKMTGTFLDDSNILLYFIKFIFMLKISTIFEISSRISEKFLLKEKFQNIISLFKVFFISIFVAHFIACLWYFAAIQSQNGLNWVSRAGLNESPWNIKYLYSMYWACVTMMTVGYGDITPQNQFEIIACIISVILGCAVYAYNINSIGMIMQDLNKENSEFDRKINIINQFMRKKNINQDLQMRIREYLRFIWKEENTQNVEDEQKIISLLTNSLRDELLINAYGTILKKFPMFFANFSTKSLTKVVSIIKDIRLFPEEEIFFEDDDENLSIYFVMKGKVELYSESGVTVKEIGVGELFGEIGFFTGKPRNLSAKTKDFTTLFSINRNEFIDILKKHFEDFQNFCMIRDQIMLYDNLFPLKIRCFCCNQIGHLANNCPLVHFQPDKEKVIKKFNFYLDQERKSDYQRKRIKQNSLKIKQYIALETKQIQYILKGDIDKQMSSSNTSSEFSQDNFDEDEIDAEEEFQAKINRMLPRTSIEEPLNIFSKSSMSSFEVKNASKKNLIKNSEHNHDLLKNLNSIHQNSNSIIKNAPDLVFPSTENFEASKSPKNMEEIRSFDSCAIKCVEINQAHKMNPSFIKDIERKEIVERGQEPSKKHQNKVMTRKNFNKSHSGDHESDILNDYGKSKVTINPNPVHEEIFRKNNMRKTTDTSEKRHKKTQIVTSSKKIIASSTVDLNAGRNVSKETSNIVYDNRENVMDYFETVSNFKHYFPENNIKSLLENVNGRKNYQRYNKIKQERKRSLELRLSKYTFFAEEMRNKLPAEIHRRVRLNCRKSKKSKMFEAQSRFEIETVKKIDGIGRKESSFVTKRNKQYFTTGLFEQKFSDVVKFVMSNPILKKKLKSKN